MNKNIRRRLLLAFLVIVVILFGTDLYRIQKDQPPLFCVFVSGFDDGGSTKCVGLFYAVFHIKDIGISADDPEIIDYGYHLGTWFATLSDVKKRVIEEAD